MINGDYNLASSGILEIDLDGLIGGTEYDQLFVNGFVDLNSDLGLGGMLDIDLGFAPTIGDSFTLLANDGTDAILGYFFDLLEGSQFTEAFGSSLFKFEITYMGGTGNDIVLNMLGIVKPVPEPSTYLLLGSGLLGLVVWRRRARKNS